MKKIFSRRFNRKSNVKEEYKFIYIFTDAKKTEPIYFNAKKCEIEKESRKKLIKIEVKSSNGKCTTNLIDFVCSYIKRFGIIPTKDDCWVVFDKDEFDDFDNAINIAKKLGLKVAYSNISFELWYFLHFDLLKSSLRASDLVRKVDENFQKSFGIHYSKNMSGIYELIKGKENNAIQNAEKLLRDYEGKNIPHSKMDPSTTVHLLIKSLNNFRI